MIWDAYVEIGTRILCVRDRSGILFCFSEKPKKIQRIARPPTLGGGNAQIISYNYMQLEMEHEACDVKE